MKKIFSRLLCACLLLYVSFACFAFSSCKKREEGAGRYELNVEYREDSRAVSGTVKTTFRNDSSRSVKELKFNLYPNAYRKNALYPAIGDGEKGKAYYDGENYGEITVTSVVGGKNWSVGGSDENVLTVELVRPIENGEEITLDVSFVTELAKVSHTTGVTARTVNLTRFYPRLCAYRDGVFLEDERVAFGNPFRADCADYKVALTVPSDYEVVGGLKTESSKALESKTKYVFEANGAREFACVLSKVLKTERTTVKLADGKTVDAGVSSCEGEGLSERLKLVCDALKYFSERFGAYPYPTFDVIDVESCLESSSHGATVLLSGSLSEKERLIATAREIARTWWGGSVGSDDVNEAWQSEGLASYSAIEFFEAREGYGLKRDELVRERLEEYRSYFTVYGSVFGGVDTRMSRSLKEYSSAYEYRCLARDKAVVAFDLLRKSVGDKNFDAALAYYYGKNAYGFAEPEALFQTFEKRGVDARGFLDSFLSGKAVL